MYKVLEDKVKKTVLDRGLIEKGDRVFVGFSGGPDSACLLHILIQMRDEWVIDLHAIHMNHNLRPGYADEDEAYAKEFCEKYGVAFHAYSCRADLLAAEKGITTEEAGRQARYEAFEKTRQELGGKGKIALGHNKNDQAETILLRLIRGTGPDGLTAMDYEREEGIIRPLLDVTRDEIEEYCRALNLKPRIDLTNLEPMYARNKIRLELLPLLEKKYNSNIISALVRLGTIAGEDRDYFRDLMEEIKAKLTERPEAGLVHIDIEAFKKLAPAVAKRLINQSLKDIGMDRDITALHLDGAQRLIKEGKVGDKMDFPLNYKMALGYDKATLFKGDQLSVKEPGEEMSFSYPLIIDGVTEIPEIDGRIECRLLQNPEKPPEVNDNFLVFLDYEKIGRPGELLLRSRQAGDYIRPLGMKGRKKVQDFFVDKKIPREKRWEIPMLCLDSEVLWIAGLGSSENYRLSKESSLILVLEFLSSS